MLVMCGHNGRIRILMNQSNANKNSVSTQIEAVSNFQIDTNFSYCHNCSFSQNIKNAKFCQQCGIELLVCPISKMKFSINQEFVQCKNCKWIFHKPHMDKWMVKSNFCPICKGPPNQMIVGVTSVNPIFKE